MYENVVLGIAKEAMRGALNRGSTGGCLQDCVSVSFRLPPSGTNSCPQDVVVIL